MMRKEWVLNELQGYKGARLPDYRWAGAGGVGFPNNVDYQKISECILKNENLQSGHYGFSPEALRPLLQNVDNQIYYKTVDILNKLRFEKNITDIFYDTRETVNNRLISICPTAFEKLQQLYENAIEIKSELDIAMIIRGYILHLIVPFTFHHDVI